MNRSHLLFLAAAASAVAGCATCASPYDCYYAAYGGSRPRGDMSQGRVASAFSSSAGCEHHDLPAGDDRDRACGGAETAPATLGPALQPASPDGILRDESGPESWHEPSFEEESPTPANDAFESDWLQPTPAVPRPQAAEAASDSSVPLGVQLAHALEEVTQASE